jgi:hypothetical protein
LSSLQESQVEIARISLESTTADVISIRAKREEQGISYNIVDEYESEFFFEPQESELPLTMGDIVRLIDQAQTVDSAEMDDEKGLTDFYRNLNLMSGADPTDLIDFVTVSSEFYPDLQSYYRDRALEWAEEVKAKRAEPG